MDLKLKGKTALIMGSSSGLGLAVAKCLADEGVKVALSGRKEEKLKAAAKEVGAELTLTCNLNTPHEAEKLVQKAIEKLGHLDILVTNTGGPPKGTIENIFDEQWHLDFQGLWMSPIEAIRTALPGMRKRNWGRIIMITSISAKEPLPELTISNGFRAGLMGLAKSISNDNAKYGVTINSVLPGYTKTARMVELGVDENQIGKQIPAGRMGTPEEFGSLVAFIASERASYITGQTIACDGGYLRGY